MPDATPARRPTVLLLAGEVRDDWTRALEAGGIDVATTGWLDGITAARLKRPDLLLVSTDLPEGAPPSVLTAFRSTDLGPLPIVLAGPGADRLDQEVPGLARPDLCLPGTVAPEQLPERVRAAIREGRVTLLPRPARNIGVTLVVIAAAAMASRLVLHLFVYGGSDAAMPPTIAWLLLAAFVLPLVAAGIVALRARTRPISLAERRSLLGWLGLMTWNVGRFVPGTGQWGQFGGAALGMLLFAAWAWQGQKVKRRSRGEALTFRILAGALVLLAGGCVALAAWASSRA